jgi:hypothetical protein
LQHPWLKEKEGQESAVLTSSSSRLEDDAEGVSATTATAKTATGTDSISTSTSTAVVKTDHNASSGDLIRAILDR